MSAFVITIPEIESASEKAYAFAIAPEWLREALEGTGYSAADAPDGEAAGTLDVVARSMGEDVLADVSAKATLRVPCARCNDEIDWPVAVDFTQLFVPRGAYQEQHDLEEIELSPEDLERETYAGEEIALDTIVRENLILEVPMTPRCPDGCSDPAIAAYLDRPREPKKTALSGLLGLKAQLPSADETKGDKGKKGS